MIWNSEDFENPADSLVYYADLALVTVSDVCGRKRTSKVERKRHISIAACLLYDVIRYEHLITKHNAEAFRQLGHLKDVWSIIKAASEKSRRPTIKILAEAVEAWATGKLNEPSGISG